MTQYWHHRQFRKEPFHAIGRRDRSAALNKVRLAVTVHCHALGRRLGLVYPHSEMTGAAANFFLHFVIQVSAIGANGRDRLDSINRQAFQSSISWFNDRSCVWPKYSLRPHRTTWCDRGGRSPRANEVRYDRPHKNQPRGERPCASMLVSTFH